MGYSCRW